MSQRNVSDLTSVPDEFRDEPWAEAYIHADPSESYRFADWAEEEHERWVEDETRRFEEYLDEQRFQIKDEGGTPTDEWESIERETFEASLDERWPAVYWDLARRYFSGDGS